MPSMTSHPECRRPIGWPIRVALLAAALGLGVLLIVARRLEPDPRGFGTHLRLGLWPCAIATLTGRPCPTCGMTTSFAWFTRGDLRQAWRANPAGCLLAVGSGPAIVWLIAAALRGAPPGFRSLETPILGTALIVATLCLGFWLVRIAGNPRPPGEPRAAASPPPG
jgi:hypothetical protein